VTDFARHGSSRKGTEGAGQTFFSWLGVSVYLTEEAIDGTLELILSMPRSSEIVLDFMVPLHLLPPDEAAYVAVVAARRRVAESDNPEVTTCGYSVG
jgi:O-methyltransferase involved in polyketide biosynthesis